MRFFNTEGPIRPDRHYHVPPLERVDLDELLGLVRDERYFVLHAPRQTVTVWAREGRGRHRRIDEAIGGRL